jgi:putative ABC transport system substrate-binding protein
MIGRREFVTLLGGAATWPLAARAQQSERMRRIGVLLATAENDPNTNERLRALQEGLQARDWVEGRNLLADFRWAAGDPDRMSSYARELVALKPDLIVANSSPVVAAIVRETRTIPIVFVQVADPVGAGFVASLAKPGGNVTGFADVDYAMGGKWLEILKEIAPRTTRAAILMDRQAPASVGFFGAMQAVAPLLGLTLVSVGLQDAADIERGISGFAQGSSDGLVVIAGPRTTVHREAIIDAAARHRLPAIYPYRFHVAGGGLVSYGVAYLDLWQRAAAYVDRILKGEKPADLPVQAPTKFELAVNLKTAKALGLALPDKLLAIADEVIE